MLVTYNPFSALTLLVGWQEGHPAFKNWVPGAGVVVCLDLDLHMAQPMPLPLIVSCFSKIQIGFTFLVPAHPGSPGKRAAKRVCVCVSCWLVTQWTDVVRLLYSYFGPHFIAHCEIFLDSEWNSMYSVVAYSVALTRTKVVDTWIDGCTKLNLLILCLFLSRELRMLFYWYQWTLHGLSICRNVIDIKNVGMHDKF